MILLLISSIFSTHIYSEEDHLCQSLYPQSYTSLPMWKSNSFTALLEGSGTSMWFFRLYKSYPYRSCLGVYKKQIKRKLYGLSVDFCNTFMQVNKFSNRPSGWKLRVSTSSGTWLIPQACYTSEDEAELYTLGPQFVLSNSLQPCQMRIY